MNHMSLSSTWRHAGRGTTLQIHSFLHAKQNKNHLGFVFGLCSTFWIYDTKNPKCLLLLSLLFLPPQTKKKNYKKINKNHNVLFFVLVRRRAIGAYEL